MASEPVVKAMLSAFGANWSEKAEHCRDKETVSFWMRYTEDIADDLLRAAAKTVISESAYFPKVSDVRAMAFRLQKDVSGVPEAEEAWGMFCRWQRATKYIMGPDGVPRLKGPLPAPIQRAVDAIGGLRSLAVSENAAADRARFIAAYERMMERAEHQGTMLPEVRRLVERAALPEGLRGLIEGGRDAVYGESANQARPVDDVSGGVLDSAARSADPAGRAGRG